MLQIIHSSSTNVYHNLAVEDALLDDDSIMLPVIYVYRNDNAVVLGKNQNPWRECNVGKLDELGVHLARRVTGGGTVFHDSGNLNVSLILPRENYNRCDVLQWTMDGLRSLGLNPEIVNDTSIVVDGKKVSGNAFCYRRNRVLHHGTLLWDADLGKLRAALKPALEGVDTRAIASVPMAVRNLKDLLPAQSLDDVRDSVVNAFAKRVGKGCVETSTYEPGDLATRVKKMQSWTWRYGNTPDFKWTRKVKGQNDWIIDVHRGKIRGVEGGGDKLVGQMFVPDEISRL